MTTPNIAEYQYYELPIDADNEALIITNAILDSKHREYFSKKVQHTDFRYQEYQTLAWGIIEIEKNKLAMDVDTLRLKANSSPVRKVVTVEFIQTLLDTFKVIDPKNYDVHIEKLKLDKVKSEIATVCMNSLYKSCLSPETKLDQIYERGQYIIKILEKGYSYSQSQFKTMEEVAQDFIYQRDNQSTFFTTGFKELDDKLTEGLGPGKVSIICGLPGMGKCLAPYTKVLMYDGSFKLAKDIVTNDLLMGIDSTPRKVLNTVHGYGNMYRIDQTRGISYTVNGPHQLSLIVSTNYDKQLKKGTYFNISVEDYIKKSGKWKNCVRGYRTSVDFPEQPLPLDPYLLGIRLGDGNNDCQEITTIYKINSRHNRLRLLAGLLDSGGSLNKKKCGKKRATTFEITTKYKQLADDISYLSRSLGFYTSLQEVKKTIKSVNFEGIYYEIRISGNTELIPTCVLRKHPDPRIEKYSSLVSKINVTPVGVGEYCGFELDGDHQFLLEDFTVTHNSSFCLSSMKNLANLQTYTAQFALEMNNTAIFTKLLAYNTRIAVQKISKFYNQMTAEERQLYDYELSRLSKNKFILLDDTPGRSLAQIREQTMILQDRFQQQYWWIVIDLFGKISDFQSSDNFARAYEQKLNIVQPMARELGINMGLVAQINRGVTNRKFTRPKMSDLKNAGALEEVADLILGIHRPFYNPEKALQMQITYDEYGEDTNDNIEEDDPNRNIAEVIILKQRMGESNILVNFFFDPDTTCYGPIAKDYQSMINASKTDLDEDFF